MYFTQDECVCVCVLNEGENDVSLSHIKFKEHKTLAYILV